MRLEYCRVEASKHDKDQFLAIIPETFGPNSTLGAIEVSHPYGFASRPVDKDDDGACGAYYGVDGAQGFAWLANDGRIQAKLPEVLPGESFQYGVTGNFVRCHKDGRISLFTTDDATVDGRTVALTVGPTGLIFNAPWGSLRFDATGFHVLHSSGARIDLGACGGLPSPLDALASYATLSAAMVHVDGSAVSLGAGSPTSEPPAKAVQATQALSAITTALVAVGAALATIGGITTSPAAGSGAAATAATAIGVATVAVTTAIALMPSNGAIVS